MKLWALVLFLNTLFSVVRCRSTYFLCGVIGQLNYWSAKIHIWLRLKGEGVLIVEFYLQICVVYTSNLQRNSTWKRSVIEHIPGFSHQFIIIIRTSILLRRFLKWKIIIHFSRHFSCLPIWIPLKLLLLYIILMLFSHYLFILLIIRGIYQIIRLKLIIFLSLIKNSNNWIKIVRDISIILLCIVYDCLFH